MSNPPSVLPTVAWLNEFAMGDDTLSFRKDERTHRHSELALRSDALEAIALARKEAIEECARICSDLEAQNTARQGTTASVAGFYAGMATSANECAKQIRALNTSNTGG